MAKTIAIRKMVLKGNEIPDPMYPPEDGRTVWSYTLQPVPITVKPYPLKKKYR